MPPRVQFEYGDARCAGGEKNAKRRCRSSVTPGLGYHSVRWDGFILHEYSINLVLPIVPTKVGDYIVQWYGVQYVVIAYCS